MAAIIDEFRIDRVRPQREWGLLVVNYLFLGGAGAGLFLASLAFGLAWGEVTGLLAVAIATLFLFLDLGHPERFWRAFARPKTSWISRGSICITLLIALGGVHAAVALTGLELGAAQTGLSIAAAAAAIIVMVYTGFVLSPSPAIPFWNSAFFPMIFFAYSLLAGLDILILLALLQPAASISILTLEQVQIALMIAILLMLLSHLSITAHAGPAARQSIALLVHGRLRWPFFGGVVIVGLILPLLASWPALWLGVPTLAGVAAALSLMRLTGDYLFRLLVIRAGHYDPPL